VAGKRRYKRSAREKTVNRGKTKISKDKNVTSNAECVFSEVKGFASLSTTLHKVSNRTNNNNYNNNMVIIESTGTISKSLRQYLSNLMGKREIKELKKKKKTAILCTAHKLRKALM